MNSDIRIAVGFWSHYKTRATIKALGLEGVRSLQILWIWAAQNRSDGHLARMDWERIEFAAEWEGQEKAFFDLCLKEHWIDEVDGEYYLHDWKTHNAWASREQERSDSARLSRLSRERKDVCMLLKADGRTGITSDEYELYKSGAAYEPVTDKGRELAASLLEAGGNGKKQGRRSGRKKAMVEGTGTEESGVEDSGTSGSGKKREACPPCPTRMIAEMYNEILYELPSVDLQLLSPQQTKVKHLQARWKELWGKKYHNFDEGLERWRDLFTYIRDKCPFLMGKCARRDGPPWRADFAWIVKRDNFDKIVNGNYNQQKSW